MKFELSSELAEGGELIRLLRNFNDTARRDGRLKRLRMRDAK
jgi:hypothetical protein